MEIPRLALPPHITQRPFTVKEAHLCGVTPGRLRHRSLTVPTSGARIPSLVTDRMAALRAFALVLPGDTAFSHATAARIIGLPLPAGLPDVVHVMRESGRPPIERAGCISHQGLQHRRVGTIDGIRVVVPGDTWADLGATLSVADLVIMGDALLAAGWVSVATLAHRAEQPGRRGARRLRVARALCRPGSASPGESRARLRFGEWGLPDAELNLEVYAADGRWLARPDFTWRQRRVIAEYDGDQHRTDRAQWQRDRHRRAGLEDEGWTYVEMTARSLSDPLESERLRLRLQRLLT